MVSIKFTPPVKVGKLFDSIDYVTYPISRVPLGWFWPALCAA